MTDFEKQEADLLLSLIDVLFDLRDIYKKTNQATKLANTYVLLDKFTDRYNQLIN